MQIDNTDYELIIEAIENSILFCQEYCEDDILKFELLKDRLTRKEKILDIEQSKELLQKAHIEVLISGKKQRGT